MDDVVIAGAARTPVGAFNGGLSSMPGHVLGEGAIAEAIRRARVEPGEVPGNAERPPGRCGRRPSECLTVASHHSPLEYRPAAPVEESSSLTTAGSRVCRGCPN